MNLSFSTRGWGDLSWDQMLQEAVDMRFGGVEVYNLFKFPELTDRGGPFHSHKVAATIRQLRDLKLKIPCFDTSVDLSSDPQAIPVLTSMLETARNAQVPYVVACALTENEELVGSALEVLLPLAEAAGVTLLLKTSGIYADTARLRSMLESFASDWLGALWDMHHPYRDFGESADATIKNLGTYVKHVHLRDSDENGDYQLIGEGNMPIPEMIRALGSINYDGFISLEWKPEWMEDLQDREIIFPYYVNYMSRFHSTRTRKKSLYYNHDGSGQYVWKKNDLIDLTFPQVLDRMVEEFPDQYCFKYTTLDYTRTYEEFRDDVDTFARALVSLGVRPGMKVAVWATNVPAWYITFWATTKIGAVLVTANTAYKIHEAEYLLRQSDTHTLIFIDGYRDSNYKQIISELCPELESTQSGEPLHCKRLPFLRNVITVGFSMKGAMTWDEAKARAALVPEEELHRRAAAVSPDDVCNMQYTSGTTGFPKSICIHSNCSKIRIITSFFHCKRKIKTLRITSQDKPGLSRIVYVIFCTSIIPYIHIYIKWKFHFIP